MNEARTLERAEALLELGRGREAEILLREMLVVDANDPDILYALARSVHAQERYSEARDVARRGLRGAPEHLGLLLSLSVAHAGLREFGPALEAVHAALQIAPDYALVHRQQGVLLLAEDRSEDALAALGRAHQLDPESSETIALIAAGHFNMRRYNEAEATVADALRLDPNNAEAHRIRGLLALRRGGGAAAVSAHRSALQLDPTDADFRDGMATALKSRNPLYGMLLRFGHWQSGLSDGTQWAFRLAPLLAIQVLRPVADEPWGMVVLGLVIAFLVLSWTLEPVQNAILLCSTYSRNLLPSRAKGATWAFLANMGAGAAAATIGAVTENELFLLLGLGFAIWSVTAGHTHLVDERRFRLAVRLQLAGAALGIAAAILLAVGATSFASLAGIYFIAGLAMLWFAALA